MKVIKTALIQKQEGKKKGKYLLILEVTDYDIEMFEDLVNTDAPYEKELEIFLRKNNLFHLLDWNKKYKSWINKSWYCFHKLWSKYDR